MNRPPVRGLSQPLEINSIFCIGRNYVEHARELNNELTDEPVVFLKPVTAVIYNGDTILLPRKSSEVHHEVELVVAIGRKCKKVSPNQALNYVAAYGIGVDVTARDIQSRAKKASTPWTISKGFNTFAPLSDFISAEKIQNPQNLELKLEVNGEVRQKENTRLMIYPVARLISYLSEIFTLHPGDLIFTGTPAGVSPIQDGDKIRATLEDDLVTLSLNVKKEVNSAD